MKNIQNTEKIKMEEEAITVTFPDQQTEEKGFTPTFPDNDKPDAQPSSDPQTESEESEKK